MPPESNEKVKQTKKEKKADRYPPAAASINLKHAPLTSWEEYAQALLQANETSFVN